MSEQIIEQILRNWTIPKLTYIKKVETGLLNQTYVVRTIDEIFVLQKLHPAVSMDTSITNYFHVTQFLLKQGKISQQVKMTNQNSLWVDFDNSRWRLLKGVEGKVYTVTPSTELAFEAGKILALFHTSLKDYPDKLLPTLPMFQYKQVLTKLLSYETNFINSQNQKVISAFLLLKENFPKLLLPDNLPTQIIHTDPKISNFLFDQNNKGICMIDLDTIQTLSPLYDIGDCVRSLCGQAEDDPNNNFDVSKYEAILSGYNSVTHSLSKVETELIPQACQLIMLGLASRFLNDYIDDDYFGWDSSKYKNRQEHNLARTLGQISLWNSFTKSFTN